MPCTVREYDEYIDVSLNDSIEAFEDYVEFIDVLKRKEIRPINLYLNCPGGCTFTAYEMLHWIERYNEVITAIVIKQASSMGAIIAMACDNLIMSPYSYLMFHDSSASFDFDKCNSLRSSLAHSNYIIDEHADFICQPFLTCKECKQIRNGHDLYICDNDPSLQDRIKRHFHD